NDLLLQINDGAWDNPPALQHCPGWLRIKMRRFLGLLHRDGLAVWKDPRTTLTFRCWKPYLQNYQLLATVRHPCSVAQSLQRRDGFSLSKGLSLWREYNGRLLELCRTETFIHWADFDAPLESFAAQLRQFAQTAGLIVTPEVLATYDPALR